MLLSPTTEFLENITPDMAAFSFTLLLFLSSLVVCHSPTLVRTILKLSQRLIALF